MSTRVTVVMPVYNGLPYLREAIESVLSQTFKDFELLVMVDGPQGNKDGSFEYAQSYAAYDPRIRVIMNEENIGTARTMNKGIEMASAPIVARLDQDDISYPRRLELQLAYLKVHAELMIVSTWEYGIDAQTRKVRKWQAHISNYGAFLAPLVVGICPIWHPSIMFRRDAMRSAGGYDGAYSPVEDFEVTTRLGYLGYRGGMVEEYLVGQRHHGNRQSVTKLGAQIKMRDLVHNDMIKNFFSGAEQERERLGKFLRMDPAFLKVCRSKEDFYRIISSFTEFLNGMRVKLNLNDEEFHTMTNIVYVRLGRGVRYADALRHLPTSLFFPAFSALSPFFSPALHFVASLIYEFMRELRYPGRLLRYGLERRDK